MHVTTMPMPATPDSLRGMRSLIGRCHLHPLVDYGLIGGAITLPIFSVLYFFPELKPTDRQLLWFVFLFINGTHFAASTVRLYTKPGATREFPFLSWGFPVICLAIAGMGLYWPVVGNNLTALYFTWSPYHYAAQTYGLAVMYAMRSGGRLDARDKTHLRWVCLVPFLYALFTATEGGLAWFIPRETLAAIPALSMAYAALVALLSLAVFALPFSLFWMLHRLRGKNVPLITVLLPLTNGIWWVATDYPTAWWWAAMFHSIQYLLIVVVMHVNEQMARPELARDNALHHPMFHAGVFYGISLLLGAFLFFGVPAGYIGLGFGAAESFWMFAVVINLHHFIVDGFIWRNKAGTPRPPMTTSPLERVPEAV
jgi:hypothetical protein